MSVGVEPNGTWTAQVWYRDYNGDSRHKTKRGFKREQGARLGGRVLLARGGLH